MVNNNVFITVNHTEEYGGVSGYRIGDKLTLHKDHNNIFDDEAIMVYGKHHVKCGYVANSVDSVARGTYSAGRLYDLIGETCECVVKFIIEGKMIACVI